MKKITIYAKEYPNRVTMGAMIDFKRETGKDANDIGVDIELLTMFMYCCVRSSCRAEKREFPLSFEEFADGMDLSDLNTFQEEMSAEEGSKKKKEKKA